MLKLSTGSNISPCNSPDNWPNKPKKDSAVHFAASENRPQQISDRSPVISFPNAAALETSTTFATQPLKCKNTAVQQSEDSLSGSKIKHGIKYEFEEYYRNQIQFIDTARSSPSTILFYEKNELCNLNESTLESDVLECQHGSNVAKEPAVSVDTYKKLSHFHDPFKNKAKKITNMMKSNKFLDAKSLETAIVKYEPTVELQNKTGTNWPLDCKFISFHARSWAC